MIDFKTAVGTTMELDPTKRVNYVPGLVLGADEFIQEHTYLDEKHRLHNRLLHGYGTISGLLVVRPEAGDSVLRVEPGWAVDQRGREIYVPYTMCVDLNKWLDRHRKSLEAAGFAAGESLSLCVMLRYRECEADTVPVPGEPCRSQDDVMQASRVADSFDLELCVAPVHHVASPPGGDELGCCPTTQPEEDAVRAFGELLERIDVTTDAVTYATSDQLVSEVLRLGDGGSVSSLPGGSLPGGPIYLPPDTACGMIHEALRVWVTTVRPKLLDAELGDECDRRERGVLLADLTLAVTSAWLLGPGLDVDESRRPYLLHTRLLQEWLMCGRTARAGEIATRSFATLHVYDLLLKFPHTSMLRRLRAWIHRAGLVTIHPGGIQLEVDGTPQPRPSFTQAAGTNVFEIEVPQPNPMLPPWSVPANARVTVRFDATKMTETENGHQRPFVDVLNTPGHQFADRDGHFLVAYTFAGEAPVGDAGGDLGGAYPEPRVAKLSGGAVGNTAPTVVGQLLTWDGKLWTPEAPAAAGGMTAGDVVGPLATTTVVGLQGRALDPIADPTLGDQLPSWIADPDAAHHTGKWTPTPSPDVRRFPDPNAQANQCLLTVGLWGRPVDRTAPVYNQALVWGDSIDTPGNAKQDWAPRYIVGAAGPIAIVAAGFFTGHDVANPKELTAGGAVYNGLHVFETADARNFRLWWADYAKPSNAAKDMYIVKATVFTVSEPALPEKANSLEIPGIPAFKIPAAMQAAIAASPCVVVRDFLDKTEKGGILIRATTYAFRPLEPKDGLMIEISRIGPW